VVLSLSLAGGVCWHVRLLLAALWRLPVSFSLWPVGLAGRAMAFISSWLPGVPAALELFSCQLRPG